MCEALAFSGVLAVYTVQKERHSPKHSKWAFASAATALISAALSLQSHSFPPPACVSTPHTGAIARCIFTCKTRALVSVQTARSCMLQ